MGKIILGLCLVLTTSAIASEDYIPTTFREVAQKNVDAVFNALTACRLQKLNPYDPRLPRPQIQANAAIANGRFYLLAYYLETYGFGLGWEFKAPNGGSVHSVRVGADSIHFVTPYAGTVAHANSYNTIYGPRANFYCHSIQVASYYDFQNCISHNWINVISGQLCRFPNPVN